MTPFSPTDVLDVITRARDLIADPERWTQFSHAEDGHGNDLPPWDEKATCFCADGALARAAGVTDFEQPTELYTQASNVLRRAAIAFYPGSNGSYVDVNDGMLEELLDGKAHQQVMQIMGIAIASLSTPSS